MNFLLYTIFVGLFAWSSFAAYFEYQSVMDDGKILAAIYGVTAAICFVAAGCVRA